MTGEFKIKNNTNNLELTLRGVRDYREDTSQATKSIDWPEGAPMLRTNLRMVGQEQSFAITCELYDSDTDLSNGHDIKTAAEQRTFLRGEGGDTSVCIFTPNISDTWTLTLETGEEIPVTVNSIPISASWEEPGRYTATLNLTTGTAAAAS